MSYLDGFYVSGIVVKLLKLFSVAAVVMCCSQASASFVSLDWKVEGDSLANLHEQSGTEWLKLSQTDNMSIGRVQSELVSGGIFEGWRLPTFNEVNMVTAELYGSRVGQSGDITQRTYYRPAVRSRGKSYYSTFSSVFGSTFVGNRTTDYISYGLFLSDNDDDFNDVLLSGIYLNTADRQANDYMYYYTNWESKSYTLNYTSSSVGVYLVADGGTTLTTKKNMLLTENNPNSQVNYVAVPEPMGVALLGMGMVGLMLNRRKITDV
jgi:hypothetical protein